MSFRLSTRLLPPVVGLLGLFFLALPLLAASGDDEAAPRTETHLLSFAMAGGARLNFWIVLDVSERPAAEALPGIVADIEARTFAVAIEDPEVAAAFTLGFGKWADEDIPVPLSYNDDKDPPGIDGRAVLLNEAAVWNAVPDQDFAFTDGGTSPASDSVCDTGTNDGINNASFEDSLDPPNVVPSILAWVCTLEFDDGGEMLRVPEFDMQISLSWTWTVGAITQPGEFDLLTVVLHELGHAFGLNHSGIPSAVMFPSVGSGQQKRSPTQDDIESMQFLYGDFIPTPTETPTFTPTIPLVDLPTITPTPTGSASPTPTATATQVPTDDTPFEVVVPGMGRE